MLLIFIISGIFSADTQNRVSEDYSVILNKWINADIEFDRMLNLLSALDSELDRQPLNSGTNYWKSRISLLRGQIYYERKEKALSIRELEESVRYAGRANTDFEESLNLSTMAMANSLLMVQKGLLYIISNFLVPQRQMNRALELDPENHQALLIKAQFLCNAPPVFGGNLQSGINLLKELSDRTDISAADRFYIIRTKAEVYLDNNRKKDAAAACREALAIFPGNISCREILAETGEL